jgi:hypothetical protein
MGKFLYLQLCNLTSFQEKDKSGSKYFFRTINKLEISDITGAITTEYIIPADSTLAYPNPNFPVADKTL